MSKNKLIAFGDIHGCFEAAETAVKLTNELNAQAVFLGDYVDRGPSSIKTLETLVQAKNNHQDWVFLRGNHDQMLLDLIDKKADVNEPGKALGMNFHYKQAQVSYEEFKQADEPKQEEVYDFLNNTIYYYETEQYIFSHAILNNDEIAIQDKSAESLMFNYERKPIWRGKTFVHGHRLTKYPAFIYNGININTECGYGGYLCGLVLQDEQEAITAYSITQNGVIVNRSSFYVENYKNI